MQNMMRQGASVDSSLNISTEKNLEAHDEFRVPIFQNQGILTVTHHLAGASGFLFSHTALKFTFFLVCFLTEQSTISIQ